MPRFAANLSFLYQDLPFIDRIAAAAHDGFGAVEYVSPYEYDPDEIRTALNRAGIVQALFNLPAGDWGAGERGIGCLPDRVDEFRAGVARAIAYARALDCPTVNCLAGIAPAGVATADLDTVLCDNLAYAAQELAQAGIALVIEPVNRRDIPGFHLATTAHAERLIERIGSPNVRIQYDVYHMQIMQGDLAPTFADLWSRGLIGHVQIADTPGRGEPGTGEINYPFIFNMLDRSGYAGWTGCEYKPTAAGLGWMHNWYKENAQ